MKTLNYQLKQLCRNNRDGSYTTQAGRERQLTLIANQLDALGYRHMNAQSLKPKHVEALVKHWQEEGISTGSGSGPSHGYVMATSEPMCCSGVRGSM